MTKHIVALSVDKVQTLLFQIIRSHQQEKQVETATLRDITHSSYEISKGFFRDVQSAFPESENTTLLACSGVYIFECTLMQDEIKTRLKSLFANYYRASQGQKFLKYTFFCAEGYDENSALQEAKKQLKDARCLNEIVTDNQELLFDFQPSPASDSQETPALETKPYQTFVHGMNELYSGEEQKEMRPYKDNHFRIAIIKADLDGMGSMFREITDYDQYSKISELLNEHISLKGLDQTAEQFAPEHKAKWIFPFYVAGDDIFFAVSVANFTRGIDVCRAMLKTIHTQLKALDLGDISLSMSIGVDFTFNREPIRYYIDRVEDQLKCAKKAKCPSPLETYLQMKISINNLAIFDLNYEQIKEDKKAVSNHKRNCQCSCCQGKTNRNKALKSVPSWQFFLCDLRILNHAKSVDGSNMFGNRSFFYSLLERLTDENIQKDNMLYMNNLLYHLLPQYLDSPHKSLRKSELLAKKAIISQLYQNGKNGDEIVLNQETKHRLETYLRLMLLLTDTRFSIVDSVKQQSSCLTENEEKDIGKYLFTKPVNYLYDELKNKGEPCQNLLKTLIKLDSIEREVKNRTIQIPYFKRVKIEKSMFFRLRDTDKFPVEKAADMIEICNRKPKEPLKPLSSYQLSFDKNKFRKKAVGYWTPDFVDSVMLLFAYTDMAIKFKTQKKEGKSHGKKN